MKRQVYCVGLRKKVEADIDDIIAIDGKRGTKYQGIGSYTEESNGKTYTIKSWVSKSDYENMHGKVSEVVSEPQVMEVMAAESEEFIGAKLCNNFPL